MLTTYSSLILDVAALVVRTTFLVATFFTLSEAIKQFDPQTRFVMSLPTMVLEAA